MIRFVHAVILTFVWRTSAQSMNVQGVNKTLDVAPGYPLESYFVETSDGYILKLFRIPGSPKNSSASGKKVVFLMHGLVSGAHDWIVLGPGKAIGYLLADAGFDVWLGNARGNTYSRANKFLLPSSAKFWNFSFYESGVIDVPAFIDFILNKTGEKNLHYIGHSQGTTNFFNMVIDQPKYNEKIITMHAFAPVAYMNHVFSPSLRLIAPLAPFDELISSLIGYNEVLPSGDFMALIGQTFCSANAVFTEICANVFFLMFGYDSPQLNRTLIPKILLNSPAGGSTKQMVHFAQLYNSGEFEAFDYYLGNTQKYGTPRPPKFDLKKVTARVFLHYSGNDWLSSEVDAVRISKEIGNLAELRKVPDPLFNHIDYIFATNASGLLYNHVIEILLAN